LTAEFIGTFALIFIGAGAAIALALTMIRPVVFAQGLTILVFVTASGDISGGHFNPAPSIRHRERAALTIGRHAPDYNGSN
jgi:aquaporin Z